MDAEGERAAQIGPPKATSPAGSSSARFVMFPKSLRQAKSRRPCETLLGVVFLGAAASVAAAAWLYLVLGHGGFWRTSVRLPAVEPGDPPRWPEVGAVVPARDEAAILPETLPTLLRQRYPGE